jgi:uncharacterized coiled-coil protein SlyX
VGLPSNCQIVDYAQSDARKENRRTENCPIGQNGFSLRITMQPENSADERLIRLETALMQLEHDVEQLNQSLVAQHRALEALRVVVERLEWRLDRESPSPPETRDPEAEKPPHY